MLVSDHNHAICDSKRQEVEVVFDGCFPVTKTTASLTPLQQQPLKLPYYCKARDQQRNKV